jgi:ubiquinone biosynthesis protein COQ9
MVQRGRREYDTAMSAAATDWAAEAEQQILEQAIRLVPHEGWTSRMARLAGQACGFSQGETELLVPHGAADLAALFSRRHDAYALVALRAVEPGDLKIRERIRRAVEARLDAAAADEPATRRWAGYLTLPQNLALGARLTWESADVLWRWAGDTATDENHYSKRVILAGILSSALAIRMAGGRAAAMTYVERRIEDVMRFEKWKATTRLRPSDAVAGLAQALGRLRYRSAPKSPPDLTDVP